MGEFKGGDHNINRAGRKKGTQNKYTKQIKEAFGMLLENNLEHLSVWLAQVAADDPKAALDIVLKMSERFVPRLKQTDITSDGENIMDALQFRFGPAIDDTEKRDVDEE